MQGNLYDEYCNTLFGVRKSIRYHIKRRQFFERADRTIKLIVVLSGTGAFITLSAKLGATYTMYATVIVAFFSAIDLIIRTSEKAILHHDIARRFTNLEKQMISIDEDNITNKDVARYISSRLGIEADEPPAKRILDIICHNELNKAMGNNKNEEVKLEFWQKNMANFFDINLDKTRKKIEC